MARKKTTENNDIRPIKRRSRSGCHNCKRLKVKCDETKPVCLHCSKNGTACDYSLKLLWGGRPYKTPRVEKTTSYTTIVTTRTVPASADLATQLGYQPLQNTNNDCQGPQNVIFQESPLQQPVDTESFIMETPRVHFLPANYRPSFTIDSAVPASAAKKSPQATKPPTPPHVPTSPMPFASPAQSPAAVLLSSSPASESDFTKDIASTHSYEFAGTAGVATVHAYNHDRHSAFIQTPLRNLASSQGSFAGNGGVTTDDQQQQYQHNMNLNDPDIIDIPRPLDVLPDILKSVPLYRGLFHHFVHVTANLLVPAPTLYPQNPFKVLLPSMSLNTPHLMDLILAYAATHRAHLLKIAQPVDLITRLLARVFSGLTRALENDDEAKSDTTLTTAIMLASYAIYSGDVHDAWKKHLHGARDIVIARGLTNHFLAPTRLDPAAAWKLAPEVAKVSAGPACMIGPSLIPTETTTTSTTATKESDVAYFLVRWFSYIDVIGGLSSAHTTTFTTRNEDMAQLWALHDISINRLREHGVEEDVISTKLISTEGKIDFLLGVDLGMLPVFSKVSYLARQKRLLVEQQQEASATSSEHDPNENNSGDSDLAENCYMRLAQIQTEARELITLITSFCAAYERRRKQYITTALNPDPIYSQLCILSVTFCLTVILQIYRRILDFPSTDPQVQRLVTDITALFDAHIPQGSDVESCMSFPIFVTACEVLDPQVRDKFYRRVKQMERFGAGHVIKAREIMEICWNENRSWADVVEHYGWDLVLA
ncbi:Conserved hypothetical protein. Putative fungal zinc cluster transcription factor [Geotrichum candidum]|uniref:Zn(2)-C6 fungal-type domain-containing protein n=1 Tax=Geotrichum candidum TaxID=1173061 RepID=A0A0J9X6D5_GEOCN|nr:Conserved hypothetical protein. Putative fungal zinc cluster transcription factor [Geotrichum candidum]